MVGLPYDGVLLEDLDVDSPAASSRAVMSPAGPPPTTAASALKSALSGGSLYDLGVLDLVDVLKVPLDI